MKKIIRNIFILLILSPLSLSAQTQQEIVATLAKKLANRSDDIIQRTLPSWYDEVNSVFTEALTLEAMQAYRESQKVLTGKILKDLRASWLRCHSKTTIQRAVELGEKRAGKNLERLYRELGDIFQTPDELGKYIEEEKLVEKGLLSEGDLLLIQKLKILPRIDEFSHSLTPTPETAFRSLQELRIHNLREEMNKILEKRGKPIHETLNSIVSVLKNLSERNQYLWGFTEAQFALKLQYHWYYLWTNFRHVPHLKRRWLFFWRRWQALAWIKVPAQTPKNEIELANFLTEFTQILADSLAYPSPRTFLSLPRSYVRKAVEKHARVLTADFEIMERLKNISPEIEESLKLKMKQEAALLDMEAAFDMGGFEGLLNIIRLGGKGDLETGIKNLLKSTEGRYTPLSGHFGRWIGYNIITAFFIAQTILGHSEEESPPETPPYPGDELPLLEEEWPEYKGEAPLREPSRGFGDISVEVLIYSVESRIQKIQEEQRKISEKLSQPLDNPQLKADLEKEYKKLALEIKMLQRELEQLRKLNPPSSETRPE